VKVFFIPVMTHFLLQHISDIPESLETLLLFDWSLTSYAYLLAPLLLKFMFLTDVAFFLFGYLFEARWLRNAVVSVDATLTGWIVTLLCYPPLNQTVAYVFGGNLQNMAVVSNTFWTVLLATLSLMMFSVYVWATVSLGTRCSNLTNRGIVGYGAYRYIRHPAYASKVVAWWIGAIPLMTPTMFGALCAWSMLYGLRAITEERHLSKDPAYRAYSSTVPYRFIPRVV